MATGKDGAPCCQGEYKLDFSEYGDAARVHLTMDNGNPVDIPIKLVMMLNDVTRMKMPNMGTEVKLIDGSSVMVRESAKEIKKKYRWEPKTGDTLPDEAIEEMAREMDLILVGSRWPHAAFKMRGMGDKTVTTTFGNRSVKAVLEGVVRTMKNTPDLGGSGKDPNVKRSSGGGCCGKGKKRDKPKDVS